MVPTTNREGLLNFKPGNSWCSDRMSVSGASNAKSVLKSPHTTWYVLSSCATQRWPTFWQPVHPVLLKSSIVPAQWIAMICHIVILNTSHVRLKNETISNLWWSWPLAQFCAKVRSCRSQLLQRLCQLRGPLIMLFAIQVDVHHANLHVSHVPRIGNGLRVGWYNAKVQHCKANTPHPYSNGDSSTPHGTLTTFSVVTATTSWVLRIKNVAGFDYVLDHNAGQP